MCEKYVTLSDRRVGGIDVDEEPAAGGRIFRKTDARHRGRARTTRIRRHAARDVRRTHHPLLPQVRALGYHYGKSITRTEPL